MPSSWYYGWEAHAIVSQSSVHLSDKNVPPSSNVDDEVTEMATALNSGTSETSSTAVRVTELSISNYHHEALLLKVNRIIDPEIPLRHINDVRVLFFELIFHVYAFDHQKRTLSVTSAWIANRLETCDGARSANTIVHNETACVVLQSGRQRLHALRGLQKARDSVWVEAPLLVQCVARQDGHMIVKTEIHKLSHHANEVSNNLRCCSVLVMVVKSAITFSASFERWHCMLFLAAQMVNIVVAWFRPPF